MHRIKATLGIGLVAAGVATSVAMSTPAGASKSHASSPKTIVVGVKGRTMATGWTPFAALLPYKPATAGETSTNGALGVAYFAFPSTKDAAAYVKKPSTIAVVQARNAVPIAYTYAAQGGLQQPQELINESQGVHFSAAAWPSSSSRDRTVVLGTYLGAAPASGAPYNLDAIGLSAATQEAATVLDGQAVRHQKDDTHYAHRCTGINNKAMPGLPSSNWRAVQDTGAPPAALAAASVTSGDSNYTVSFYDFSTPAAATAFYNAARRSDALVPRRRTGLRIAERLDRSARIFARGVDYEVVRGRVRARRSYPRARARTATRLTRWVSGPSSRSTAWSSWSATSPGGPTMRRWPTRRTSPTTPSPPSAASSF